MSSSSVYYFFLAAETNLQFLEKNMEDSYAASFFLSLFVFVSPFF